MIFIHTKKQKTAAKRLFFHTIIYIFKGFTLYFQSNLFSSTNHYMIFYKQYMI